MTNSELCRGSPSQSRALRSSIRPAFQAKSGSRGKIQLRCGQGRRASALSPRQRVVTADLGDDTLGASPPAGYQPATAERAAAPGDAEAYRRGLCTTTLGGKEGGTPATRLLVKARQPGECESLAPLAHDLARRISACGDDIVGQPLCCQEYNFSSPHITIR